MKGMTCIDDNDKYLYVTSYPTRQPTTKAAIELQQIQNHTSKSEPPKPEITKQRSILCGANNPERANVGYRGIGV